MRLRRREPQTSLPGAVVMLGFADGVPVIYLPDDSDIIAVKYVSSWIEASLAAEEPPIQAPPSGVTIRWDSPHGEPIPRPYVPKTSGGGQPNPRSAHAEETHGSNSSPDSLDLTNSDFGV